MGIYNFENFQPKDTKSVEKLERISFALNQLFTAVAEDALKVVVRHNSEDVEEQIKFQAELLLFCSAFIDDHRTALLDSVGIIDAGEDGEELFDSEEEVEETVVHRVEHKKPPISLEEIERFRRMLGDIDKPQEGA